MFILSDMLGIPQDIISNISSSNKNGIFIIHLSLKPKPHSCPSCGHFTSHIKEYKIKRIKHSLLNRQKYLIHYKARRFVCDFCGRSFYEENPFSLSGHSISNLTIINVLNEIMSLLICCRTEKSFLFLNISIESVWMSALMSALNIDSLSHVV